MLFLFLIHFSQSFNEDSLSILTNRQRKLILTKHQNVNIKERGPKSLYNWYYVHFITKDISHIQKIISIAKENLILPNTYILFLSQNQVNQISNISLIHKIEPQEKYYEDSGPIEKNSLLLVSTLPNYDLSSNKDDFIIEGRLNDALAILNLGNKTVEQKNEIIKELCDISEVRTVTTYKYPKSANSLMTAYTQHNFIYFKKNPNRKFYYMDRYLNLNGITGENEVITIIDSPIDFNHAMFRDDDVDVEFNKLMPNHRKIIYYYYEKNMSTWENEISEYEHGTHVAGTAAGKSICSNDDVLKTSIFNGNAPDAKIAYAGSNLHVNITKFREIFSEVNSKVSSNSWGNDFYTSSLNTLFGSIALINPNVTFIFAAGNSYEQNGNFSIGDPQGSKNVLTVGSLEDFYASPETFVVTSIQNPDLSFVANDVNFMDPIINATIGNEPGKTDIYAFDNSDHNCKNLLNNNKFLIYGGGDISWIYNCEYNGVPNFLVFDNATLVKELLDSKSDVSISKNIKVLKKNKLLRTSFSSTGPGSNGILKPDLMAPGSKVISAKSRSHSNSPHGCGESRDSEFIFMNGTSMAAPNIAGGAALIRHYFNSGKWMEKVILDGETTRALLINSCTHPFDSKIPDIMYGHGTVDLSTVIPIENDFGVQITHQRSESFDDQSASLLENENKKSVVTENGHVVAKLNVNTALNSKKLQITLSYLDMLIDMDSPIPLIHDLDLIVTSPSKKIYLGDHLANKDTQHASTNEKVIIKEDELEDGTYTIHVYGGKFIDRITTDIDEQEFSVVASGPIQNGYLVFSNSTECPCDKCDPNKPGYCFCDDEKEFGQVCQIKIDTIVGNKGAFTVGPLEVKRLKFSSKKTIKKLFSSSDNPGHGSTIWASKDNHLSIGEYEINGYTTNKTERNDGIDVGFGEKELCVAIFNNNDREATYNLEVSDGVRPTSSPTPKPTKKPSPTSKYSPTPEPTHDPDGGGEDDSSSSSHRSKENSNRESSTILGDKNIRTVFVGASSIIHLRPLYSLMYSMRKVFGSLIPSPDFIHSAIWVSSSESEITDETVGAIFVYGKYYSNGDDKTYLSHDGARSYIMTFGEFKKRFSLFKVKQLKPQKDMKLFDFIKAIKESGNWDAKNYNWPTNNCQHFTCSCLNILNAIRYSPNDKDWIDIPQMIMKVLNKNEVNKLN